MRDLLERWHDDFTEVLSHVSGRREWGVKAYVDPPRPIRRAGRKRGWRGRRGDGRPGTAYLKRRQASMRNREQRWRGDGDGPSRSTRPCRPSPSRAGCTGPRTRSCPAETSGWCSTAPTSSTRTGARSSPAALDALRGQGVDLELTGPWAPYSFIALEFDRADLEVSGDVETSRGSALAAEGRLPTERVALVDLLDRLLAGGVVVSGDLVLSIADIDLVRISLRALIMSVREESDAPTGRPVCADLE